MGGSSRRAGRQRGGRQGVRCLCCRGQGVQAAGVWAAAGATQAGGAGRAQAQASGQGAARQARGRGGGACVQPTGVPRSDIVLQADAHICGEQRGLRASVSI